MKNRRTQSALLVAGAAAGAVAATWIGRRRLRAVGAPRQDEAPVPRDEAPVLYGDLVEPDRAELPLGSSADPDIDGSLSRRRAPYVDTSGGALLGELDERKEPVAGDASLDEVWNSMPGLVGGEQTEGYDAVQPEDMGAVWLERATETTHDERPHASDPDDVPNLEGLTMSEASRTAALAADDDEIVKDEDSIADDDLDLDVEEDELRERPRR